jgi:GGDEF domain-containing protein
MGRGNGFRLSLVLAVLREADVAMYTAKARGKGRFELAATSA